MSVAKAESNRENATIAAGICLVWVLASTLHLAVQIQPTPLGPSWALYFWLFALPFWGVSFAVHFGLIVFHSRKLAEV